MGSFTPHRDVEKRVCSMPDMRKHLQKVADKGAAEIGSAMPNHVTLARGQVTGDVVHGPNGYQAEVNVRSPLWHLLEFGTIHMSAKPWIRPAAQALLSQLGGRFKSE